VTLAKHWAAACDEPGCVETWRYPGSARHDRWDVGVALNDAGWQAGPAHTETYCPGHFVENRWDQRSESGED
jgi:hypothetical protein